MIDGTFDVIGAAGPRAFFEHLTTATLAHGYLFSGPQGVGKKTFARALAQSLLCVTPKRTLLGWCGHCTGCTRFAAGTHPDFYAAQGQLKIGERDGSGFHDSDEPTARDLVRQLSLHSYAGGMRVFVLGDADFTREAANALLKFFEEPPAGVVLIVTSYAPGRVLPTIKSRLVEVTFPSLAQDEVVDVLLRAGIAPDDARQAAAVANGSATRALAFLEEGEGATRDAAVEWFFAAARGEAADAAGWATRPTLEAGLETVKTLARDYVALQLGGSVPLLAADQRARLAQLPAREPAAYVRLLTALGDADRIARTNVSPPLVADLVRMALAPARADRASG
ncbi:MAG TPA: DNA polymerase III subunit [Candidatus Sulfotelmatobacter sp.]|nr:DNA polymerase III subunit [Candidatus Sulfotelmatobacter sp.]